MYYFLSVARYYSWCHVLFTVTIITCCSQELLTGASDLLQPYIILTVTMYYLLRPGVTYCECVTTCYLL